MAQKHAKQYGQFLNTLFKDALPADMKQDDDTQMVESQTQALPTQETTNSPPSTNVEQAVKKKIHSVMDKVKQATVWTKKKIHEIQEVKEVDDL